MFPKIRWRVSALYLALTLVVLVGLAIFLTQPDCLGDSSCTWQRIIVAILVLGAGAVGGGYIVGERTARPLRQLTTVIQRITAGERHARILPQTQDETGRLIHAFNQMAEQLVGRLNSLTEEYYRLATAVQYMADGLLITDDASTVTLINPAAMRLLETTETASLGRSFAEVVRHHQLIDIWQRCQEQGKEQSEAVEIGKDRFLQTIITPVHERGARGYLVVLQDLTTVRRLQTVRRDFISNVSHELRTPLASLRAVVDTLQDGAMEEPQVGRRFLVRAERELDTMTQMVEELLELSRIESGQVPLRLRATAVSDLLLLPIERLRDQAQRAELHLALNISSGLPAVLADAGRVQQVVTNLLHNAVKFTPPGGSVTLHAYQDTNRFPDEVVFSITDTGDGITAEDLPRIFERFFKSDRARTRGYGGTGLGLAISRHIVEAHQGRIWVKSKQGRGSTFYFTLPIATPSS